MSDDETTASGVPVDAVEDFGGPGSGGDRVHDRADAGAGAEAAPADSTEFRDMARRSTTHPADGQPA